MRTLTLALLASLAPACTRDAPSTSVDAPAAAEVTVPSEPAALQAWLADGGYRDFPAESGRHPSAGPHGGDVRAFLTPSLLASFERGAPEHPRGAAAVKELYDGDALAGWAVSVKLADASANGDGWYWYEVFSAERSATPGYEGVGLPLCTNCHVDGRDFVLTPFPLQ